MDLSTLSRRTFQNRPFPIFVIRIINPWERTKASGFRKLRQIDQRREERGLPTYHGWEWRKVMKKGAGKMPAPSPDRRRK
jgi:hypothetical protein